MRSILSIIFFLSSISGFSQKLTFNKDISPIIEQSCTPCHREQGNAPFPLSNYEEVAKRGKFIDHVVKNNIMPPWKADPHYRSFANEKLLTDKEKKLIADWVKNGMPEGKKKDKTTPLNLADGSSLQRKADLVLKMKSPFRIEGNNKHSYICYKIPYELERDTFVNAIEFIPGNKSLVHHASYQVLEVGPDVNQFSSPDYFVFSDSINSIDDEHDYSYFNLISRYGKPIERYHGGWLPGVSAQVFPEGMGFYLPKKGVLLIRNLHYSPTPIEQYDQSSNNLYFSSKPVERIIGFAAFKPTNLDPSIDHIIKADSIYKQEMNIRMNSDASFIAVNPHMHQLGKTFKVYGVLPSKDTVPIVYIPSWDFNWQEFYFFKKPVKIPKGTVIHAEATFDNTTNNPNNPYSPPRDIYFERGNMDDTEEMMRLVFLYLPYKDGDEMIDMEMERSE